LRIGSKHSGEAVAVGRVHHAVVTGVVGK
jgi:hypothetical protein